MRKKIIFYLIILPTILFSQTTRTGGSRSSGRTQSIREQRRSEQREERQAYIQDFIVSVIGSMLRHPDPKIRMQAVQSIIAGMASGEVEGGGGRNEGLRSFFAVGEEGRGGRGEEYGGAGAASFVPDLYTLLNDPDPEIRDIASVGLDVMFGSEVTLLRFMDDPDPLVRKYATKIFTTKSLSSQREGGRSREEEYGALDELIALRTLLVRLKYEKDEEVRKTLMDGIEYYLHTGGRRDRGGREEWAVSGVDASLIKYLKDPNPELRKNAAKIIGEMEYSQEAIKILMEALKEEKDESVKNEINRSIDKLINAASGYGRERGGGAGVAPR